MPAIRTRLDEIARATGRMTARGRDLARQAFVGMHGARWAFFDQCLVSAANFVTIFVFARYLETDPFGRFMLAFTGLVLMTSMQSALIVQPHNVLAAGLDQPSFRRFTGALAVLQGLWCVGLCVVLAIAGCVILALGHEPAGRAVIALAVVVAPCLGQEFVRRVFYTRGDSRAAAINDAVTYGLQMFGALVLVHAAAKWSTAGSALLVLGLSSAVGLVVGCWQLRRHVRFEHWRDAVYGCTWREVWGFGKWLTAQNGLMWFGSHGHVWVVGLMLGAEQVGFYRAVTHLANIMNPMRQAAYGWLPARGSIACQQGGAEGLTRWVRRTRILLLAALVPFCILLVGFPGWVLGVAYGDRYAHESLALLLALTTVAQCLTFVKFPFDLGLLALRATKRIFYVHLIPVALLFTSGVALIHFLGILGVPVSALIINLALLAATWVTYRQAMAERRRDEAGVASRRQAHGTLAPNH